MKPYIFSVMLLVLMSIGSAWSQPFMEIEEWPGQQQRSKIDTKALDAVCEGLANGPVVRTEIDSMLRRRKNYDPKPLLEAGPEASLGLFSVLFPELFIDAPKPVKTKDVKRWIGALGHDSFMARESASRSLLAAGAQDPELLKDALASEDFEVRFRAERVLQGWRKSRARPEGLDPNQVTLAFGALCEGAADHPECRKEIARCTIKVFDAQGFQPDTDKFLIAGLRTVWASGDKETCARYVEMLPKLNEKQAGGLVGSAQGQTGDAVVALVKNALGDKRQTVQAGALECLSGFDDATYGMVSDMVSRIMEDEKSENHLLANAVVGIRFTNAAALEVISKALKSEGDSLATACEVLGMVGGGKASLPEALLPAIDEALTQKKTRRPINKALKKFTGEAVFERLFKRGQMLTNHPDEKAVREFLKKKMETGTADEKRKAKNLLSWF